MQERGMTSKRSDHIRVNYGAERFNLAKRNRLLAERRPTIRRICVKIAAASGRWSNRLRAADSPRSAVSRLALFTVGRARGHANNARRKRNTG